MPILDIARRTSLRVIEDAAQAFGAEYRGKPVGAIGDCGTVSFYPSKISALLAMPGLLVTNDAGSRNGFVCCGITARSSNTFTASSAEISGWTPFRRPCCG